MVMNVTDLDFKEKVIEKSKETTIVVDFWAQWCQPCLMLGPILEELEEESKNKFILVKVNVEEAPETSKQYSIMSIPSVKMFKDGKIVSGFVGVKSEDFIKGWLKKNLK